MRFSKLWLIALIAIQLVPKSDAILHTIFCNILLQNLPVTGGCTCKARIRLLTYLANFKLDNCGLNIGGGLQFGDISGTPTLSMDAYLRNRPSTITIGLTNVSFGTEIPSVNSSEVNVTTYTPKSISFSLTGSVQLSSPLLTVSSCKVKIDSTTCAGCSTCNSGQGIAFNCSNYKIANFYFSFNDTDYPIYFPDTGAVCNSIPL